MANAVLQEGSALAGAAAGGALEGMDMPDLGDAVDSGVSVAGPAANLVLGRAAVKDKARQAHKAVNEKYREGKEEKEAEIGPYDISAAGMVRGLDDIVAGYERNRKEKPWHYWLNPYVPGPSHALRSSWWCENWNCGTGSRRVGVDVLLAPGACGRR